MQYLPAQYARPLDLIDEAFGRQVRVGAGRGFALAESPDPGLLEEAFLEPRSHEIKITLGIVVADSNPVISLREDLDRIV